MVQSKVGDPTVLVVDEALDFNMRSVLSDMLQGHTNIRFAEDYDDAVAQLKTGTIDGVLANISLSVPRRQGGLFHVAEALKSLAHGPNVIVFSSQDTSGKSKLPFNADDILKLVRSKFKAPDSHQLEPLYKDASKLILPETEITTATWDFQRALEAISKNPKDMINLTPRQFEEVVAEMWRRFGYEVELTSATGDGGRDVIALRKSEAQVRFLIECKRYSPEHKVGVSLVRSLLGVKTTERATKAILATTSTFTRPAKELLERHIWELEGRNFDGLLEWIKRAMQKPTS